MKEVTIPTDKNPYIIHINNDVYTFNAGETVVVPDEVAAVLEEVAAAKPKENPPKPIIPEDGTPGQVLMKTANGYEWADLPISTVGNGLEIDEGKLDLDAGTGLGVSKSKGLYLKDAGRGIIGGVLKGEAVEEATSENVVEVLNALIASLADAGTIYSSNALSMMPPEEEE